MKFNNTLDGLDSQAIVAFKQVTLKARELQYALDVAIAGGLADQLVEWLQVQGIDLSAGTPEQAELARSQDSQVWVRQGFPCEAFQPGQPAPLPGKLRLRVSWEFRPDDAESGAPPA